MKGVETLIAAGSRERLPLPTAARGAGRSRGALRVAADPLPRLAWGSVERWSKEWPPPPTAARGAGRARGAVHSAADLLPYPARAFVRRWSPRRRRHWSGERTRW